MEELLIEEKAKRYDSMFERLKEMYNNNKTNVAARLICERYFPELKESEDEKIRKDLINYFNGAALEHREEEVIAWLEKQGEKKPVEKVEPKFKQGDIIREKETGNLFYVNSIEDFGYTLHYKNCNANGCTMSFKYEDKYELIEQKPAWSEEDEEMYRKCICAMRASACGFPEEEKFVEQVDNWLKSLRPQNVWISVDEEVYVKEPVLAQMKDKSDSFGGFIVCCDHTLTPNVYERYMILGNIVS